MFSLCLVFSPEPAVGETAPALHLVFVENSALQPFGRSHQVSWKTIRSKQTSAFESSCGYKTYGTAKRVILSYISLRSKAFIHLN